MKSVIWMFLLTYGTTLHPMMSGKSSAEFLMEWTVRTINQTVIPKNKTKEIAESHKRRVFTIGDLVFARGFQSVTAGRLEMWSNEKEVFY